MPCTKALKTRYVDGTPTSEVTPVTIWYTHPSHHGWSHKSQYHGHEWTTPVTIWYIHPSHHGHTKVNIMVMNGQLQSLSGTSTHPTMVTQKSISWSWAWMDNSSHYLIHPPTPPWSHKSQYHGHEWTTPVTITHHGHTNVNIMVMNGQLQSLHVFGTSTHPTMVTQKSISWSWMDNSCHYLVHPPIPPWSHKSQYHGHEWTTPVTIWYTHPSHHGHTKVNIMVMNGQLQSLFGTSTHPTMVTQKSISWSWMDNSHPFRSMSINHPIPEIIKAFSNSDLDTFVLHGITQVQQIEHPDKIFPTAVESCCNWINNTITIHDCILTQRVHTYETVIEWQCRHR